MTMIHQQAHSKIASRQPHTQPHFSIIISTYNRRNIVLEMLQSLEKQTLSHDAYEVVVVDNGSHDGTFEAIRDYTEAHTARETGPTLKMRCLLEPHNGLAYARQTALRAAQGDIAVFLDDDVLVYPDFLENLLRAYNQTGADAIGVQITLLWESDRPYWLQDTFLPYLGYFAPGDIRMQLPPGQSFGACGFSVTMQALQHIGLSSPLLSKRAHIPINLSCADLCDRLRNAEYTLWYEPEAIIAHRVPSQRLHKAFFLGRAYWQGRSEILAQHLQKHSQVIHRSLTHTLTTIQSELRSLAHIILVQRSSQLFTGRPATERFLARMEQAHYWGRLLQKLQLLEHTPASLKTPVVLLIHPGEKNAELIARSLWSQAVRCTMREGTIPISWIWHHRSYLRQATSIIHIYRPGALNMPIWQRASFLFQLGLARLSGIRIVSTDVGGWWQHSRGLRRCIQQFFERCIFTSSDMVLSYTLYPKQLYPDAKHDTYFSSQTSYYPQALTRTQALLKIGLTKQAGFLFLCLAHTHTEQELINIVQAFTETYSSTQNASGQSILPTTNPQLLIVGKPYDTQQIAIIRHYTMSNAAIHLYPAVCENDLPIYLEVANAVILPHQASRTVGTLEIAMLCHSHGKLVVMPGRPQFPHSQPIRTASTFQPATIQTFISALTSHYNGGNQHINEFDVTHNWHAYTQHLLAVYQHLLARDA